MTWWLTVGDCRDVLGAMTADVMIVDPPYANRVHTKAMSCSPGRGVRHRDLGFVSVTDELRNWIAMYAVNSVRRWSVIYSDIESVGAWASMLGAHYIRAIPWVRWSMPQLSGDRPPQGAEMLVLAWGTAKGRKWWNGPGNLIALNHKCLRGENKHKAEKPLDQMLDLVSWFSDYGETIVDPCAGYGTVGMACAELNRHYVGVEIDPATAETARRRLEGELKFERDAVRLARWLLEAD